MRFAGHSVAHLPTPSAERTPWAVVVGGFNDTVNVPTLLHRFTRTLELNTYLGAAHILTWGETLWCWFYLRFDGSRLSLANIFGEKHLLAQNSFVRLNKQCPKSF